MTECNSAAVDIGLGGIKPQPFHDGQGLSSEGLVRFNHVHLVEG